MKIDLFQADFIGDEYRFSKLPNHGHTSQSYTSNGHTYTRNRIEYPDTIFFIYCNHVLNEKQLQKLKDDWIAYCPH